MLCYNKHIRLRLRRVVTVLRRSHGSDVCFRFSRIAYCLHRAFRVTIRVTYVIYFGIDIVAQIHTYITLMIIKFKAGLNINILCSRRLFRSPRTVGTRDACVILYTYGRWFYITVSERWTTSKDIKNDNMLHRFLYSNGPIRGRREGNLGLEFIPSTGVSFRVKIGSARSNPVGFRLGFHSVAEIRNQGAANEDAVKLF